FEMSSVRVGKRLYSALYLRRENVVVARRRRAAAPEAPLYTLADVTALSETNDEPLWLRESREAAWELYQDMPMPSTEEEWRRTDYRGIHWDEASPLVSTNDARIEVVPPSMLEPLIGDEQGGTLVFVDGKLVSSEISPVLTAQGV